MTRSRMEAFSDGVIAILITIMVLELGTPEHGSFEDLIPLTPVLLSYILSFVFLAIYWNNHHHMLQAVRHVDGRILWANMHLLFWLSLVPFTTSWMGESHFAADPVTAYGIDLLMCAIAYYLLVRALLARHESDSHFARAVGNDVKGRLSLLIYAVSLPIAQFQPVIACVIYAIVAVMWLIPDRRFENQLREAGRDPNGR